MSAATIPNARPVAAKIARWLVERGRSDDAIQLLCAHAASGPNDVEGQQLLAEALRLDASSILARQAFERMEGIAGDHTLLEASIAKFNMDQITRMEREMAPAPSFRRAQVGFNNNVKYQDQVFHVQTEDSGLDKPHIITHLFADGGRIIKSHKRIYASEVRRSDIALYVRALMKKQQMEMLIMLREGRFDPMIFGNARGGMDVLEGEPNVDVKRVARKKTDESAPPDTVRVPTPPPAPALRVHARLHVQRSPGRGPAKYDITNAEVIVGSAGTLPLPGETFCHPREAAVRWRDEKLWLEDLDGGNGAFLRVRSRVELTYGDEFIVGDQLFRIERNPVPDDEPDPDPTYFYSSPKWPSQFRVVQVFEGGALGACAVARGGMVQIGSAVGDIVCHTDPLVSEQHCLLEEQAGVVVLADLDSRTGTFVRLQGEAELAHGDEILIGRTRLLADLSPSQP